MKLDLHTHSVASPDGSLTEAQYRRMLDSGQLDCIAVTDHNIVVQCGLESVSRCLELPRHVNVFPRSCHLASRWVVPRSAP